MKLHLYSSYRALFLLVILLFVNDSVSQTPPSTTTPFTTTFVITNVNVVNGQTQTAEITVSSVVTPAAPSPTNSGNSSSNGNNNGNQSSSSSTPSILPTANPSVDGGGNPGGLAPSPGGGDGLYGPNDNFIAGALTLQVNTALITLAGIAVGVAMIL